jgi:hypothetical protein
VGQIQGASAGGDLAGTYPSPSIRNGAVTAAKLAPPEAFTEVGLPEARPFCDDAFGDSWQSVSPNVNNAVGYSRDPYGRVALRGIAKRCGNAQNPIFTLPAGYRPARQEIQPAVESSGLGRVNVDASGHVAPDTLPATDDWVSLDGITFRCAPSGANGCP